jgi:hypothetical protein
MSRIRYFVHLSPEDRIRVDFETERGKVTILHVVQYETAKEGEWYPVARYDTAHGYVHLDLETPTGKIKYRMSVQNWGEALTVAIEDLKANWNTYKRRFGERYS